MPVALAGPESEKAKQFYAAAKQVVELAQAESAKAENVFEVS